MLGRFSLYWCQLYGFGWQSIGEVFCDIIQSFNEITAGFDEI